MAMHSGVAIVPAIALVAVSMWYRPATPSSASQKAARGRAQRIQKRIHGGGFSGTKSLSMIQLKPELKQQVSVEMEQTPYTPAFEQLRMPGAGSGAASGCPHQAEQIAGRARGGVGGIVKVALGNLVAPKGGSYLLSDSANLGSLTVASGAELVVAPNVDLSLRALYVEGLGGTLRMGSATCPLSGVTVTFTGAGDKGARSSNPLETKGLVVGDGGLLEVFGVRYAPTWTRLSAQAQAGSSTLQLMDEVDWQVGQQIVVITTAWTDDPDDHQNEVREITAVTISEPLQHDHYGGPEYFAEVALLSRSITFQGDEASEGSRYGGHFMCMGSAVCRVAGVLAYRMGQENVMGRYAFHFHMMGDVAGESFFEDNAVRHSFFRAFTIHGTSSSRASRNVAYDVSGSAYYLEDGIEENNLFDYNLAARVRIIDQLSDYGGGGQGGGVTVHTQPSRIVPTDATAVGFYCTNAKNRLGV
ncbi:unnamed protein product [Effrenium voratum]|uniref:G8 domain-containing protein n=1 Tax=Effrenium voratum TaxID=2562239 RepID=A0AA36MVN9_9DINO|nr:unnamed protein product [Effrenium voratum]